MTASVRTPIGPVAWTRASWVIVFLVSLTVWTLSNLDQSIFGYVLPGILAEFHRSLSTAGVILAISFVVSSVFVVLGGVAADRYGRGLVLAVVLASSACAVGLQAFAGSIAVLTVLRTLGFGFAGALSPITAAYVVETVPARLRGLAIGVLQCGFPLGWFLASLVAVPLLHAGGWRDACLAGFAVAPFALPIAWLLRRATGVPLLSARPAPNPSTSTLSTSSTGPGQPPLNRIGALFTPEHRVVSIACMVTFFCFAGAYAGSAFFFTTFFVSVRHYSPAEAISLVGSSNGIGIVGYLAAALIGEFLLARRTVFIVWVLCGALALLGLLWLPRSHGQDFAFYAVMAGFFYGAAAVFPVIIAELFPTRIRGTALAVCGSMPQCLGFGIFPLLVPLMVQHFGWQMALSLVVVPPMVVAALAMLAVPARPSGLALPDPDRDPAARAFLNHEVEARL